MAKRKRRAVDAAGVLPDDLMREIFARVAPGALDHVRCAGTCTRWFRLISCPAFLRRVGISLENARHRSSFLLGAFYIPQATPMKIPKLGKKTKSRLPPRFFRLRTQQTGGDRLTFTTFIPNKNGIFNYAWPLAAHRGLLLDLDPMNVGYHMTGYALVTATDHLQPVFQVLFTIECYDDKLVYVFSYSSAMDSWSAPIKCSQIFGLTRFGPRAGVVNGGIVHWLYKDNANFYTLNISADATHVSLTKTPIQVNGGLSAPFPCILEEGKLSFVVIGDKDVLELWTKQEQDNEHSCQGKEGWVHSELAPLEVKGTQILSFAESFCVIFMMQKEYRRIFTLNLVSNKMEQVIDEDGNTDMFYSYNCFEECKNQSHVLYEIDWPSYLFHLSVGNYEVQ
uniref:F-box domain-containing protein n=1 Tax=Aegilops tauschii TaxID=37682 RepID=M8B774_AEGTA